MPRQARIDAPGALHHIIIRGIERKKVFKDDVDRNSFLERLEKILTETSTSCFAWALMSNHVHLLIRTGEAPIATLMRRLLTGYALFFNRRYRRHGQLFQNRYKSILCQEDSYLLELVRYIHLNPLRVGIVSDLEGLDKYSYTGHAALLGHQQRAWQDTDYILGFFSSKRKIAHRKYRVFVENGIDMGRKPELVGGGLIRSLGGWKIAKVLRKGQERLKGDERILGDSDFVIDVLKTCEEQLERRYRLQAQGYDLEKVAGKVADIFDIEPEKLFMPGRYPKVVQARILLFFWAVRELGMTATSLAGKFGLTQPAVSIAVKRGEKYALEQGLSITDR